MRRSLVMLVAAATAVVVAATTAVALSLANDTTRPGWHMSGPYRDDRAPGARGWRGMGGGMGGGMYGGMHGDRVQGEPGYLAGMIAHHEEAVAAAQELRRSGRPRMRAFGADIVRTQSEQIQQMEGWLEEWYDGARDGPAYRPMMRDLSRLSGADLDRAFLEDMVWHHMTAVMLSQQLLVRGLADHAEVAALAREVRDQQLAEIAQMRQWLGGWYGPGRMPGRRGTCPRA